MGSGEVDQWDGGGVADQDASASVGSVRSLSTSRKGVKSGRFIGNLPAEHAGLLARVRSLLQPGDVSLPGAGVLNKVGDADSAP
ncbi:hypothetical protein GCM10027072_64650 [Streptomyces bullii]